MTEDDNFPVLEMREIVRIPHERIGVVIGTKGSTKRKIEDLTKTKLRVDSENNLVEISPNKNIDDPTLVWVAKDIIKAIGRGFSERKALYLLNPNVMLRIITLDEKKNKNKLTRIRGRLIGESGKTRRIIEATTGCYLSVYGNTVSIIGSIEQHKLDTAQEAVIMIIDGAKHSTVYKFLERYRSQQKIKSYELWQTREDIVMERVWKEMEAQAKRNDEEDMK